MYMACIWSVSIFNCTSSSPIIHQLSSSELKINTENNNIVIQLSYLSKDCSHISGNATGGIIYLYVLSCKKEKKLVRSLLYLLTYLRSWALLEEPLIVQPLKNFSAFYEPEVWIPCSQEPSTGLYPEPYQSNPHHPILLLWREKQRNAPWAYFSLKISKVWLNVTILHFLQISLHMADTSICGSQSE
jgi:hypothetical protein